MLLTLVIGLTAGYMIGQGQTNPQQDESISTMNHEISMQSTMDNMMMSLDGKQDDELDRAFLDEMIIHHEGAVSMAETLLDGTQRPELIQLGQAIISAQTDEIAMMKQWKAQWFNE